MQPQLVNPTQQYFRVLRTLIFTLLLIVLTGCSTFHAPRIEPTQQAAQYFLQEMNKQRLTSAEQLLAFFKEQKTQKALPNQTKKALDKYPKIAATLLLAMNKGETPQQSVIQFIAHQKQNQGDYIYVALTLYPIDGYRLAEKLSESNEIESSTITTASLRAGFDPALIFPATSASDEEYRIVPLMESASITLYNQTENSSAEIQFKALDDTQWQPGLALQWEPIQGALSGSIVYLQPDTEYQTKVTLSENGELLSVQEYSFTTRAESPPIDPNKIYYLSDIYQGGQLDLEALGIEGSADGWAKVIGDGETIQANDDDESAIRMGSQNYVMLENVTTKGGGRYGIHGYKGHHIWIKGCNVSNYGHVAGEYRNGIAYASAESTGPINYESGIYLERSGVVVIEDCEIHSPSGKANSWEDGHPKGPNAFQIWGKHDIEAYRGQYIVRNNRFYGTPDHRFNDVIEGRGNFDRSGAFVRDSAIYNNYLAFANDDLIEIDGGQANVLVYDNEMTQGYCGISTAPNMIGPSYVFHNYIHDLGDERGKEWTAIKMGGLMSRPGGVTNVFENLIITNRNGIASSGVAGDSTYWVNAKNNIIITRSYNNMVGYGIYDKHLYEGSVFKNNLIYNTASNGPFVQAIIGDDFYHSWSEQADKIDDVLNSGSSLNLAIEPRFVIPNFSRSIQVSSTATSSELFELIDFNDKSVTSFDNQDLNGNYLIEDNGSTLRLTGNTWKTVEINHTILPQTVVEFEMRSNGMGEIAGIAFENDNTLTNSKLYKLTGSQKWSNDSFKYSNSGEFETFILPVGSLQIGDIDRLIFVMDDDNPSDVSAEVAFRNVRFYEPESAQAAQSVEVSTINIGLSNDE